MTKMIQNDMAYPSMLVQ